MSVRVPTLPSQLEQEYAPHLLRLNAYEEQKLASSSAAARVCEAESGEASAEEKVGEIWREMGRYVEIAPGG